MSESSLKKQLKEMAQLSLLANRISEFHEKNLKAYPFVFFNDVKTVRIDYDLGHGIDEQTEEVCHGSRISYYLGLNEDQNKDVLDKRFRALEIAVRDLFWSDVKLEVYFNDKLMYESKNV